MDSKNKGPFTSLDLLKEMGLLGSQQAAKALSEILNCEVEMPMPEVGVVPLESLNTILGTPEDLYFVLDVELKGGIEGRTCFFLSPAEAQNLGAIFLLKKNTVIDSDDPLFQSMLKEVMNMISGAYTNVLADKIRIKIIRTPPSLAVDMAGATLDFLYGYFNSQTTEVFLIKTKLKVKNKPFEGLFVFFPKKESLQKVLKLYSKHLSQGERGRGERK